MKSCYFKIWSFGNWHIMAGFSMVAIGASIMFHCWGDYGAHLVLGPFALQIDRKQSLVRKLKLDEELQ